VGDLMIFSAASESVAGYAFWTGIETGDKTWQPLFSTGTQLLLRITVTEPATGYPSNYVVCQAAATQSELVLSLRCREEKSEGWCSLLEMGLPHQMSGYSRSDLEQIRTLNLFESNGHQGLSSPRDHFPQTIASKRSRGVKSSD
jgi:hypothetical protein